MPRYNPATIEPKWQAYWDQHQTFASPRLPGAGQEKLYVLDMFPYPSGDGLHVGHPEGYTATDIVSRAARMQGKAVIHPMGYDSFGLPAEEHAIQTGTHPRVQTEENIENFRRQLKMLGFSYDWNRELATTDIDYFRWTQWIFLQIYDTWFDEQAQRGRPISELPIPAVIRAQGDPAIEEYRDAHRLAYQSHAPVNWCPALGTVLANEEVIDGKSERGGHPVIRMPLRQWKLRITAYAERLEKDLAPLEWPESIKLLQRNWIGRSEGAEVDFYIGDGTMDPDAAAQFTLTNRERSVAVFPKQAGPDVLRVYTTRPDTLFGATYMVLAPEHPFVERLTTPDQAGAVKEYCDTAARKSDLDRTDLAKEKTGVFTGSYAINPVNGTSVPIWIADYVLISYGTGAIMAVPAHDVRDYEFAQRYGIDIIAVVDPEDAVSAEERRRILAGKQCFVGEGTAIHSGPYDGLSTAEFKQKIANDLAASGLGQSAVNYKLRDWLFSRQRFWGEPFPILHALDAHGAPTGRTRAVDIADLPIDLPDLDDFKPRGRPEPPLEKAPADWLYVTIDGTRYKRETNTMPQWAGSCWYYLRFLDPKNGKALVAPEIEKAWMPVDLYVGGAEHAVLHLLYARFWHKVLYDRGIVTSPEPFLKLINQGMILGEVEITGYLRDDSGQVGTGGAVEWVSAHHVRENRDTRSGQPVRAVRIALGDAQKQDDGFVLAADPAIRLDSRAYKMSKSRGNVVNPDAVVREYGADSLRLYEMFMGPLEAMKPWAMEGVNGVFGFLNRVWRLIVDERAESMVPSAGVVDEPPMEDEDRELHKTIKKVTDDIASLAFNTAIAKMMEFTNFFTKRDRRPRLVMEQFVLLLSPFAPHIAEELWQVLGHDDSLAYAPWPQYDDALIQDAMAQIVVQINGKVRSKLTVPANADRTALEAAARADHRITELLGNNVVLKTIVVPGRLVNFVVKPKQ